MKNSFKNGLLILAVATVFTACKGNGSTTNTDTSIKTSVIDSTGKDTTAASDTTKPDTSVTTHVKVEKQTTTVTETKKK